jgi:hypothetical protein
MFYNTLDITQRLQTVVKVERIMLNNTQLYT